MSEHEDEGRVIQDTTLMDALRRKHQDLVDSQGDGFFDLPGYDGMLIAKYRVLNVRGDIKSISTRVTKQTKDETEATVLAGLDFLARGCEEIYTMKGEERVPLADAFGVDEPPIRYDNRLAEFMGLEADGAREVILALFGGNEAMMLEHLQAVSRWMSDTTQTADRAFLARS